MPRKQSKCSVLFITSYAVMVRIYRARFVSASVCAAAVLCSSAIHAQSMMVIGNNTDAHTCYNSAGLAAQFRHADYSDLAACNAAIERGTLLAADLSATHVNRGIIHAARSDYKLALTDYRKAERILPDNPEVAINIGNLWFISGHFDQAIERYDFALEQLSSKKHVAYFNRGMAFENSGRKEQAIQDYQSALLIAPEWTSVSERLNKLQNAEPAKPQK